MGKVIYCQRSDVLNKLLENVYTSICNASYSFSSVYDKDIIEDAVKMHYQLSNVEQKINPVPSFDYDTICHSNVYEGDKCVGWTTIKKLYLNNRKELLIFTELLEECRGARLVEEMLYKIFTYEDLNKKTLFWCTSMDNIASMKCAERMGFVKL